MGVKVENPFRKKMPHKRINRQKSRKTSQLATVVPVTVMASTMNPAIAMPRIRNPRNVISTVCASTLCRLENDHRIRLTNVLAARTETIQVSTEDMKLT